MTENIPSANYVCGGNNNGIKIIIIGGSTGGETLGTHVPPCRSNFFHLHEVFGKNVAK